MPTTLPTMLHVGLGARLGSLTIFPIHTPNGRAFPYRTQAGQDAGVLEVAELPAPTVPALRITNPGDIPVLLVDGQTLPGGLQDRIVCVTVMIGPSTSVDVPVACGERARWAHTARVREPGFAPPTIRARKNRGIAASRAVASWEADQLGVWRGVDELVARHGADAPTASLHDVRDHARRQRRIPPPPALLDGQRGIVVGIGGHVRAIDLFDRPETLAAHYHDLVEAAILEAMGEPDIRTPGTVARRAARQLAQVPLAVSPSVGLGEDLRWASDRLVVSGLRIDRHLVHASAQYELALAS